MTSIPYDPSLILGQVIELEKIERLKKLAELEKPLVLAEERLTSITLTIHRLKSIENEMANLKVGEQELAEFSKEIENVEDSLVKAALKYGIIATKVFQDVDDFENKNAQTTISMGIESPLDYGKSKVTSFPLAFDNLDFDVQFIRNESLSEGSSATSSQSKTSTSKKTSETKTLYKQEQRTKTVTTVTHGTKRVYRRVRRRRSSWWARLWHGTYKTVTIAETVRTTTRTSKQVNYMATITGQDKTRVQTDTITNTSNSAMQQYENHNIEGTLVISAHASHKNADIISPFKLDPVKAIKAWNYTYPDDIIPMRAKEVLKIALEVTKENPNKLKTLNIVSGCARASTFTALVHVLKKEQTKSSQSANSTAKKIKKKMEYEVWGRASSGQYGCSTSFSKTAKTLNSSSNLSCHCNLICEGIIPSIVCNDVTTTIKKMKPDPEQIMAQQQAIMGASNGGGDSEEGQEENTKEQGTKGAQFQALNAEYMKNTVQNLSEHQSEANKIIDTNSIMTALEDFVNKAQAGGCGIPTSFYIKKLSKNDIAKEYVRKFFPNGLITMDDLRAGNFGMVPGDKDQ